MQPEGGLAAAAGLTAVGAAVAALLRSRAALAAGVAAGLGLAGLVALASGRPDLDLGLGSAAGSLPWVRVLIAATGAELVLIVILAPPGAGRLNLLGPGLAGISGLVVISVVPDLFLAGVAIIALAAGHSALPGLRSFPSRMRGPVLGVALLALGSLLLHSQQGGATPRLGALFLALGIAAAAGLTPFQQLFEPAEPAASSSLAWSAFLAPAMVPALVGRAEALLSPSTAVIFSAVLIGIGLLNLLAGLIGAWTAEEDALAWRHSFLADWGLALVGMGILLADGSGAAFLILLAMVLVRLPLYLFSRPVLRGMTPRRMSVLNLLLAGLLAGLAPFGSFAARLLLLRGSVHLYWPLAAVLALALVLWLPHAFRLAGTLGRPAGRAAVGVAIAVVASLALGIAPAPWLHAGGFQP